MIKLLRILGCGIAIFSFAASALAQSWPLSIAPAPSVETPHPAIVRIAAPNRDSLSLGSGSLVAVNEKHALVLTNWHVINEAAGVVRVIFADGFQSGAVVLAADKDWDLAALVIWRPRAQPLPVSRQIPQPGELLTIAGYGSGSFRTATGRCTQYLSPGTNFPNEIIELSAAARQGDSGGPILNARGELAGVLFGTASGLTSGSHCGRVSQFLASVEPRFRNPSPENAAAAAANTKSQEPAGSKLTAPVTTTMPAGAGANDDGLSPRPGTSGDLASTSVGSARTDDPLGTAASRSPSALPYDPLPPLPSSSTNNASVPAAAPTQFAPPTTDSSGWDDLVGHTIFDKFKTLMAAVGALAALSQILRFGKTPAVKEE